MDFVWDSIVWPHSEGAFQAAKTLNRDARIAMADIADPAGAKAAGKRIELRPDWIEVRDNIMYAVVTEKFRQNPDLLAKLIATGDAQLEEGNSWNDRYWGVCPVGSGNGENKLGLILMLVREKLQ